MRSPRGEAGVSPGRGVRRNLSPAFGSSRVRCKHDRCSQRHRSGGQKAHHISTLSQFSSQSLEGWGQTRGFSMLALHGSANTAPLLGHTWRTASFTAVLRPGAVLRRVTAKKPVFPAATHIGNSPGLDSREQTRTRPRFGCHNPDPCGRLRWLWVPLQRHSEEGSAGRVPVGQLQEDLATSHAVIQRVLLYLVS